MYYVYVAKVCQPVLESKKDVRVLIEIEKSLTSYPKLMSFSG